MRWFEWLGVFGSIASIIAALSLFISTVKKIECIIVYHKLLKMDAMQLQNFFYKSDKNKRQLIKKQNSKLANKIGKVEKGYPNKAILNKCIINMVENQENINKEMK